MKAEQKKKKGEHEQKKTVQTCRNKKKNKEENKIEEK